MDVREMSAITTNCRDTSPGSSETTKAICFLHLPLPEVNRMTRKVTKRGSETRGEPDETEHG